MADEIKVGDIVRTKPMRVYRREDVTAEIWECRAEYPPNEIIARSFRAYEIEPVKPQPIEEAHALIVQMRDGLKPLAVASMAYGAKEYASDTGLFYVKAGELVHAENALTAAEAWLKANP